MEIEWVSYCMGFLSQEVPSKKTPDDAMADLANLQGRLRPLVPPCQGTFEQIKAHRELKRRKELLKALMKREGEW